MFLILIMASNNKGFYFVQVSDGSGRQAGYRVRRVPPPDEEPDEPEEPVERVVVEPDEVPEER